MISANAKPFLKGKNADTKSTGRLRIIILNYKVMPQYTSTSPNFIPGAFIMEDGNHKPSKSVSIFVPYFNKLCQIPQPATEFKTISD